MRGLGTGKGRISVVPQAKIEPDSWPLLGILSPVSVSAFRHAATQQRPQKQGKFIDNITL
jgi:hypothetical protein